MQYKSVKGFTGAGQLGILLAFLGLGFILAGLVQILIGMLIVPPGTPFAKMGEEVLKAMTKSENVGYARLMQVASSFLLLFFPAALYLLACHGKNSFWLGFNKHVNGWQILIGFFLMLFANAIAEPLSEISKSILSHFHGLNVIAKQMEENYSGQIDALSNLKSWGEFIVALFIMAFFPAMFEEIFFRGALQGLLQRWWKSPLMAIIVTSLVFSFFHMSVYLFLSRAVLGFVLGLMYQRGKNIWVNIGAHFLNNALALIQLFWISRHSAVTEIDKQDPFVPLWFALLAAAAIYGLFRLFEKVSQKNRFLIAFEEQNLFEKNNPVHSIAQH